MAGTDIEAEKPQNDEVVTSRLQGSVVLGGQLTPENGLREILEIVVSTKEIPNGLIRVLSKDVRGFIAIADGTTITGAHVTSSCEYGIKALHKLLSTPKGIVVYMAMQDQPIELRQSMTIPLEELLTWSARDAAGTVPPLNEALKFFEATMSDAAETSIEVALNFSGPSLEDYDFDTYAAWGGELPALSSNLARIAAQLGLKPSIIDQGPVVMSNPSPVVNNPSPVLSNPSPVVEILASALDSGAETKQFNYATEARLAPPPPTSPNPQQAVETNEQLAARAQAAYDLAALEAIPSPKTDASAPGTTSGANKPSITFNRFANAKSTAPAQSGKNQQQQVTDDLDRAMLNQPVDADRTMLNQTVSTPASVTQARVRHVTQQEQDLNQLVTQRMQAIDPRSFIADGPIKALSPVERRKIEIMAIAGGIVGVGLFLALGQQVFNITTSHNKFESGLKALKSGNNGLAQVELSTAIKLNGTTAAYFYRAVAETRLGDVPKALEDFNTLIRRDPTNLLARIGRVGLFIKSKDYAQAIEGSNRILQIKPDCFDAYRLRALANCADGKYKDAMDDANTYLIAAKAAPDTPKADLGAALSTRAFAEFKLKMFDPAIKDYSDAIELDGKNAHLYSSRAVVYKYVKAWSKALADVETALRLDPSDGTLYKLRGQCYAGTGDVMKAAADLDRAVKLRPSVDTFFLRGDSRLAARDFQGAMEDFEYVISVTPGNKLAKAKYNLARANLRGKATTIAVTNEQDSALPPAKIKVTGTPSDLIQKGYLSLKAGQTRPAIAMLTAAVKGDPNSADARRYLAYAFAQNQDNYSAAAQFSALATMENMSVADRLSYAKALIGAKKIDSGIEVYSSILTAEPSNDVARTSLIKVCLQNGLVNRATDLCKEGIARSTGSPQVVETYQSLQQQAYRAGK